MSTIELQPVFASSVINVSQTPAGTILFSQVLQYEYVDPTGEYHEKHLSTRGFAEREASLLTRNMQGFMDEEENVVNGSRVYPQIDGIHVSFKNDPSRPYFTWFVSWEGPMSLDDGGIEVYEAIIEPATLEYEVSSVYVFPPGSRVVEIASSLPYVNTPRHVIVFQGKKGSLVSDTERLSWRFHQPSAVAGEL